MIPTEKTLKCILFIYILVQNQNKICEQNESIRKKNNTQFMQFYFLTIAL